MGKFEEIQKNQNDQKTILLNKAKKNLLFITFANYQVQLYLKPNNSIKNVKAGRSLDRYITSITLTFMSCI